MRILAVILLVIVAASAATAQSQLTVKGDAAAWEEVSGAWQRLNGMKSYRMKMIPPPGAQGADKMQFVIETVNPDRTRMVMNMEDMMTIEAVRVGQEFRRRITLKGQLAQAGAQQPSMVNQMFGGGIFGFLGTIANAFFNPLGFVTGLIFASIADRMMQQVTNTFRSGVWQCPEAGQGASSSSSSSNAEVAAVRLGESTIEGARTQGYDVTFTEQREGRTTTSKMRMYMLADRQVPRRIESFDASGKSQGMMDYYDYDAPITIDLPACQ